MEQPQGVPSAGGDCSLGGGQPETGAGTLQQIDVQHLKKEILEHERTIAQLESQLCANAEALSGILHDETQLRMARECQQQRVLPECREEETMEEAKDRYPQNKLQASQKHERVRWHRSQLSQEHQRQRQQRRLELDALVMTAQSEQAREHRRKRQQKNRKLVTRIMTAEIGELNTFDDAAILFSRQEWRQWKEVEDFLQVDAIKDHPDLQDFLGKWRTTEDSEREHELGVSDHQEAEKNSVPDITDTAGDLNDRREGQQPEKAGGALEPRRLHPMKEDTKMPPCFNKKVCSSGLYVPGTHRQPAQL